MKKKGKRMVYSLLITLIMIISFLIFTGNELIQNQEYFLRSYEKEQKLLTDQVGIRIKEKIQEDDKLFLEAVDEIRSELETNGRRFWLFAKGDKIKFVKDPTTSEIYQSRSIDFFKRENEEKNLHISESEITDGGQVYVIALCTEENYILEEGNIKKHNIYISLAAIVFSMLAFSITIFLVSFYNRLESKKNKLVEDLKEKNIIVESLNSRMKRIKRQGIMEESRIYEKDVLETLLKRIEKDKIFPIGIILIKMVSKERVYIQEEFLNEVRNISEGIEEEHIIAEVAYDVFAILLFYCDHETTEKIKMSLLKDWGVPISKKGLKLRFGTAVVENSNVKIEDTFWRIYQEVSGK